MADDAGCEEEICCNACGFEASFVPEGMVPCERCGDVQYCSVECLQWDWNQGGHSKSCVDKRPPPDESSSSEGDRASSNVLPVTANNKPAAPDLISTFDGEEESIMSMDVSKLFGMSPGSFDSNPSGVGTSTGRHSSKSADISKGDVKGQKSFWENKLKSDSVTAGHASPVKSKGTASKLSDFFESQSPKTSPEKMPRQLSAAKKKGLGRLSSSPIDGAVKGSPDEDGSDDESMGDDDIKFGIGQYQVTDSMDDSFDFMDTSVQTSGLKSIVEESDSWSSEDPDLEGSWRSRTPFELASDDSNPGPQSKPKPPTLSSKKSASSMLGGESEMSDAEEDENLWDTRQSAPSLLNQRVASQEANYIETDDFYEEESIEEEGSMDIEEESTGEHEQEDENSYNDGDDDEESQEIEESQDETTDYSESTPDEMVQMAKLSHPPLSSDRVQNSDKLRAQRAENTSYTTPYVPNYGLPKSSTHSEPAENSDKDDSSSGATRKRKSMGSFSLDSSSRGAASLLDFRQLYAERDAQNSRKEGSSSSRLKDFRAAYNGTSQEDSVSSTGELHDLFSLNSRSTPDAVHMGKQSEKTGKPSNEALKTSLNKALRDFEKLYGPEAARAAVERLTKAVAEEDTVGARALKVPITSDSFKSSEGGNGRSLSPSSWAMPSGVSVSSGDTDGIPFTFPSGLSGKQPRSQSMPLVGASEPVASYAHDYSFSSWAMTGFSVGSAGKSKLTQSESRCMATPAAVPRVDAVREESQEFSIQSRSTSDERYLEKPVALDTANKSKVPVPLAFNSNSDGAVSDDNQDVTRGRASSSENWLADLAASYSERDMENVASDKPIVETIENSTDEEGDIIGNEKDNFPDDESMGDPFGDKEDSDESMSEPGHESSQSDSTRSRENDDVRVAELSATDASPNPRYMKYRDTLAKQHYGADTVRKLEFNDPEITSESNTGNSISTAAEKSPLRYMTYRTRLVTASVPDSESPEKYVDTHLSEKQDASQNPEVVSLSALPKVEGKSRFQEYRSTLAKRVHEEPDARNVASPEKTSRGTSDGVVCDISREPRYQKYRSHLATSVAGTGQENTGSKRKGQDGLTPAHPLTDTPTSAPIYQQYRSALANAILASSATNSERLPSVDIASSDGHTDDAEKILESSRSAMVHDSAPVVVSKVTDGSAPRYAAYRTGLKDQLSAEPRSEQIDSLAAVTVVSKAVTPNPVEDADLEDRLSSFLSKNEKGKKLPETWSDPIEIPTSPPKTSATGPPPELIDMQARKIAAAIASSQLYTGQEKGGVIPEQKILEPKHLHLEPIREPIADPEVARAPDMNMSQPVGVTCRSTASPQGKRSSGIGEESDREMGLKLFRRNECYFYGLLICLLVAVPLGIGLGIALSRDDTGNVDVQIPVDRSPPTTPNPGLRATPNPTPTPVTETTSMPNYEPTLRPTVVPSTLSPTTETAFPTPLTWPPTETPTSLPTVIAVTNAPTSDEQALLNLLSSVSIDSGASIEIDGSPQNSAFTWLAGSNSLSSLSTERTIQRYALATLFFSTDGPNWSQASNWLTDIDECLWYSGSGGSSCDGNGVYVTLDLGFNGLMGSIPVEIGLLTGLRRLDISGGVGPGIGGPLPTAMASLVSLETFVATDNAISGSIFAGIGAWSNLRILNLKNNDMSGLLPSAIGNLVNLSFMDISFNSFSGPVPNEIGSMVNLVTLNLGTNAFTSLPASMGNLVSLVTFDASFNSLSGPLFDNWAGLASLRSINLNSNSLVGSLPASIGSISGLYQLDLSNNLFTSFIPSTYGNLSSLLILRLNSNLLTGNIPSALGNLQLVTEVRVDDNNLEGAVPSQVCDSFEVNAPKFYLDCATPEVSCPPGICCTYCCADDVGCECVLAGTVFAFLC